MSNVTTEARFQALKWQRGTGYYGAHKHKEPIRFRSFRQSFTDDIEMVKAKYVTYLLSWSLFHDRVPKPEELSRTAGDKIIALVTAALEWEKSEREPPKKRGKK